MVVEVGGLLLGSAEAALLFQAEADELRDGLLSLVGHSLQGFTLFRADLRPD